MKTMSIIKTLLTLTGLGAAVFAAIPFVVYGMLNAGVAALGVIAVLCFLQIFLLCESRRKQSAAEVFSNKGRFGRILRRLIGLLLSLFMVAELALSAVMIMAALGNTPTYSDSVTALVPGCLVKGDQPSKMLKNRLEQALIYLHETPEAKVIVTGGQGSAEQYPEAEVQANWLAANGIAPERIIIENTSTDTYGNIKNAAELMAQNGLPMQAVIFTDSFHQLRCQMYARMNGITAAGVSSNTPWGLLPAYWLREQMAIGAAVLRII